MDYIINRAVKRWCFFGSSIEISSPYDNCLAIKPHFDRDTRTLRKKKKIILTSHEFKSYYTRISYSILDWPPLMKQTTLTNVSHLDLNDEIVPLFSSLALLVYQSTTHKLTTFPIPPPSPPHPVHNHLHRPLSLHLHC